MNKTSSPLSNNNIKELKIKAKTWEKDSYGLFDFDAKGTFEDKFKIEKPNIVLRGHNKILIKNQNCIDEQKNMESLCNISKLNGAFYISNWREISNSNFNAKDLWEVVGKKKRSCRPNVLLTEDTIFKIGRLAFRVLQIKINNDEEKEKDEKNGSSLFLSVKQHYEKNHDFGDLNKKNEFQPNGITNRLSSQVCRICLNENEDIENPLLSPCLCSGSLKFIHFKCLQTWTQNRLNLDKKNGIISIEWSGLACELCKSNLPLSFKHNEKFYHLLDLKEKNPENFENFLVLESYSKIFKISGLHYIDFTKKSTITIGRSETSDIRLLDISVSRDHANISFEKGNFYLTDVDSKFGTLVLVSKPIKITEKKLLFQNGRTIISVVPIKNCKSFFSLCPFTYSSSEERNVSYKNLKKE